MKQLFLWFAVFLLTACGRQLPDDAIAAAYLDTPANPRVAACLDVLGKDPSPVLLARLRAAKRAVAPASACEKKLYGTPYLDRKPAETVSVTKFVYRDRNRLDIEFSSFGGALAASGWTVSLERVDGVWIARKSELNWISARPGASANLLRGPA